MLSKMDHTERCKAKLSISNSRYHCNGDIIGDGGLHLDAEESRE